MEERCDGCPLELGGQEGRHRLFVAHLIRLANLVEAGCSFRLDELTTEEWEGLVILRQEQARTWKQSKKD